MEELTKGKTRKTKTKGKVSKSFILPKFIELICTKTGRVKEFKTDHATNILRLQNKSGLGSYTIFNIDLYTYNEGSRTIEQNVRQSEPSEGDTIAEFT
jgi:hypothetical protein